MNALQWIGRRSSDHLLFDRDKRAWVGVLRALQHQHYRYPDSSTTGFSDQESGLIDVTIYHHLGLLSKRNLLP